MARTILLAWEMGAGLGHTQRLLTIAEILKRHGFEPVLAQRTIRTLANRVREAGVSMVPAPTTPSLAPKGQSFQALSYADLMAIAGYGDSDVLHTLLDAWDGLLRFIRPCAVIGDHCPVLPMAVRGRIPFLAFGDGFVVPPHETEEFPRLRHKGEPLKSPALMTTDVNRLLAARGQPAIGHLGQLVAGDAQVVCTFPELDIYRGHRVEPAAGPLNELPAVREPPARPRLFVYLAADHKTTKPVLKAALDSGIHIEGFVRDASPRLRQALRDGGMQLYDDPPELAECLTRASVILHHGGIGTLETALAMGCPQLLLPRHLEQALNARNLKRQQVARVLNPHDIEGMPRVIRATVADQAWQSLTQDMATAVDARRPLSCLQHLVDKVEALAG